MAVSVMNIRPVGMGMVSLAMDVAVVVRLGWGLVMGVFVVEVVMPVLMSVRGSRVGMQMLVAFRHHQPKACDHEPCRGKHDPADPFLQ